jgi:hypothetical protein
MRHTHRLAGHLLRWMGQVGCKMWVQVGYLVQDERMNSPHLFPPTEQLPRLEDSLGVGDVCDLVTGLIVTGLGLSSCRSSGISDPRPLIEKNLSWEKSCDKVTSHSFWLITIPESPILGQRFTELSFPHTTLHCAVSHSPTFHYFSICYRILCTFSTHQYLLCMSNQNIFMAFLAWGKLGQAVISSNDIFCTCVAECHSKLEWFAWLKPFHPQSVQSVRSVRLYFTSLFSLFIPFHQHDCASPLCSVCPFFSIGTIVCIPICSIQLLTTFSICFDPFNLHDWNTYYFVQLLKRNRSVATAPMYGSKILFPSGRSDTFLSRDRHH